jgi:exosortase A-associated hydrolase 2
MSRRSAIRQSASFVPAPYGARFRLVSEPATGPVRGVLLAAPAFAEEMNKCRRMASRMAQMLAETGWRVVQPDLKGCGDSACEFREATWAAWVADLAAELAELPTDVETWLWCVRGGALFAETLTSARPDLNLLLWQPVHTGSSHLQQFLRLHAGARIVGAAETTPSPMKLLRAGQQVEVGGYELNPELASGMDRARFALPDHYRGRIAWFEVVAAAAPTVSATSAEALAALHTRQSVVVDHAVVHGPQFWQTTEIEECDELLHSSLDAVCRNGTHAPVSSSSAPCQA